MTSEIWFWLFISIKVLGATCPFTSSIGAILNLIGMVARYVFIGILFFTAPEWWYGLVMLAVEFFAPMFIPRVDVDAMQKSAIGRLYSAIGSHACPVITILVYLYYYNVI